MASFLHISAFFGHLQGGIPTALNMEINSQMPHRQKIFIITDTHKKKIILLHRTWILHFITTLLFEKL
jgi:hypothetical protein